MSLNSLRKDEAQTPPPELQDHPLFTGQQSVGIMTAQRPKYPVSAPGENKTLEAKIRGMGLRAEKAKGAYDGPEDSYLIYGPSRDQMYALGKDFGQESVVFSQ